jgi:hypothetical protein
VYRRTEYRTTVLYFPVRRFAVVSPRLGSCRLSSSLLFTDCSLLYTRYRFLRCWDTVPMKNPELLGVVEGLHPEPLVEFYEGYTKYPNEIPPRNLIITRSTFWMTPIAHCPCCDSDLESREEVNHRPSSIVHRISSLKRENTTRLRCLHFFAQET